MRGGWPAKGELRTGNASLGKGWGCRDWCQEEAWQAETFQCLILCIRAFACLPCPLVPSLEK